MVETGNRTIKQKPALQHLLDGVKKHCDESNDGMRIAGVQYANGKYAIRILFPRLESHFLCILIFTIPLLQHKSDNEFPLKPE